MREFSIFLLILLLAGCVTKIKSDLRAREAYVAGQQQAMAAAASQKSPASTVTVRGEVKNETVPWNVDLTVAKAIVAANYLGLADPKLIVVTHNGQTTELTPQDLYSGKDILLQPGDVIELRHD